MFWSIYCPVFLFAVFVGVSVIDIHLLYHGIAWTEHRILTPGCPLKVILWCILSYLNRISLLKEYPVMLINISLWTILVKKKSEFFINLAENYFFLRNFDVLQDYEIKWMVFLPCRCFRQESNIQSSWALTITDSEWWDGLIKLFEPFSQNHAIHSHFPFL